MKPLQFKRLPVLLSLGVVLGFCGLRLLQFDFIERLELVSYDMRVRQATKLNRPAFTNFAFVYMDETSIAKVWDGSLGYRFGLYWPRSVYGRVVNELALRGAKVLAVDVLFAELRPDHNPVTLGDGSLMDSDLFFAAQLQLASNVVIAATSEVTPPSLFATNANAVADITTDKDADGILRRVKAYRTYRKWHPALLAVEADPDYGVGVDLRTAEIKKDTLLLHRRGGDPISVPLDKNGCFRPRDLWTNLPPSTAKPFTEQRAWHMGVVLAARELGLDLEKAVVDLEHGKIALPGPNGIERVLPVDQEGYFYIDWCMSETDRRLITAPIHTVLASHKARIEAQTNTIALPGDWRGKLVVVGSGATAGNDLTDRGATPLNKDCLLASKHWNVANSILMNRFVRRSSAALDLAIIVLLCGGAALLASKLSGARGLLVVGLVVVAYTALGTTAFMVSLWWLPMALPVAGAVTTALCLIAWRVVFEEARSRRIRSIFSKMVSPKIVHELLSAETLSLGGARCEVTVFFADVRGFTELTDTAQERATEQVRRNKLEGAAAEACFDQQARETLDTVNQYLGVIADVVIRNDGTLDKFIGDCVMAFWGAPAPNPMHATLCVRSAIQAQRAVYELNRRREVENRKREAENVRAVNAGREPVSMLPLLSLGSGINTGLAAAGLMGSAEAESLSYTVFGREVNLASRLEGASGRGRIFISETTYRHLMRDDPALGITCAALEPLKVKGFRLPVNVYEVPWRSPEMGSTPEASSSDRTTFVTGFVQRDTT